MSFEATAAHANVQEAQLSPTNRPTLVHIVELGFIFGMSKLELLGYGDGRKNNRLSSLGTIHKRHRHTESHSKCCANALRRAAKKLSVIHLNKLI